MLKHSITYHSESYKKSQRKSLDKDRSCTAPVTPKKERFKLPGKLTFMIISLSNPGTLRIQKQLKLIKKLYI